MGEVASREERVVEEKILLCNFLTFNIYEGVGIYMLRK